MTTAPLYARILIPVDGSPCSERAEREALELARRLGARTTLLHAVEDPPPASIAVDGVTYMPQLQADMGDDLRAHGRALLDAALARAHALGVTADARLVDGPAPEAVLHEAEGHDLIVMGTHGRRGLERFVFGSVAEEVLRRASVPCLLVREHGEREDRERGS